MSKYMQVLTKVCVIEHRLQRLPSEVQASRRRARRLNEMAPIELQAFSVHLRGWMQGCCCKTTENEHRFSCELLSLQCPRPLNFFYFAAAVAEAVGIVATTFATAAEPSVIQT